MHYSLESDTNTKATVAQFALYANQSVLIEGLPAGAVYYVYEYAVGKGERRTMIRLKPSGRPL